MSTLLLMPATSSAGAGGVSRSGGFRGAPIDGRRGGGFTGHRGAVGWSSGDVRAARGWRQPTWGSGAVADPAFDGVAPECQVHRVQFSDEYGWRVRNVVVCP
jgi:hypothetical protein